MTTIKYGSYTIPCCQDCNSFLADNLEKPISEIFRRGYQSVSTYLKENGPGLFFIWLSNVFLKVHLKDIKLRMHMDGRMSDEKIGDFYFWESMHHIHCLARSLYANAILGEGSIGSVIVLPAINNFTTGDFDYGDIFGGKAILIRIAETCVIAILNDSCAALSIYLKEIKKFDAPLSPFQYKEVMARMAHINMCLNERPKFYTQFLRDQQIIKADIPSQLQCDPTLVNFGNMHFSSIRDMIERSSFENKSFIIKKIKEGRWTFLFDNKGRFINNNI